VVVGGVLSGDEVDVGAGERAFLAQCLQDLPPVHLGHGDVEKYCVELGVAPQVERLSAAQSDCRADGGVDHVQHLGEQARRIHIVVNDQYTPAVRA
jgi:hypothetical protein